MTKVGSTIVFDSSRVSYTQVGSTIVADARDGSWSYTKVGDTVVFDGTVGSTGPVVVDKDGSIAYVFGALGSKFVTPPKDGVISGSSTSGKTSDRRLKNV